MDVILENIIHFLQFDIASFFNCSSNCCLACSKLSQISSSLERCIENVYEPRPKIFNDECEEEIFTDCEYEDESDCDKDDSMLELDDCLNNNDISSEEAEMRSYFLAEQQFLAEQLKEPEKVVKPPVEKPSVEKPPAVPCKQIENDKNAGGDCAQAQKESVCGETICKQIASKIQEKCSSSTLVELKCIEERAMKLWNTLNGNFQYYNSKSPQWWDLKPWQKLPFYWAALSNEILCEDPFENFKRFHLSNNPSTRATNKRSIKRQNERALIMWHRLHYKHRLPFIMEAFISKVGAGKVNMQDEHEIQRIICDLQNK